MIDLILTYLVLYKLINSGIILKACKHLFIIPNINFKQ
jgi:hypothetical protein